MSAISSFGNLVTTKHAGQVAVSAVSETIAPRPVIHPQARIEPKLNGVGRPTPDSAVRPHLHPTARIEARPVFHYDADAHQAASGVTNKAKTDVPQLNDDDLPPSTAKVYYGRARVRKQAQSSSIDLFV